jgi:catechol 2,3-dioxygenase-like lactoylglutathione lyase family enzyme
VIILRILFKLYNTPLKLTLIFTINISTIILKIINYFSVLLLFLPFLVNAQAVDSVGPICITVRSLPVALQFYTQVLPFKHLGTTDVVGDSAELLMGKFGIHYRVAHLQLGQERVDLIDFLTSGGRPYPAAQHSNDLSFQHLAIVVQNMEAAYKVLEKAEVEYVSTQPQTLPASLGPAAGIKAFYFHDPDGHTLELIFFPPGKGKAKWHKPSKALFLGIDHTAIAVKNTATSTAFWQTVLGFDKKGDSHNYGKEQAHLNFVENAELAITGFSAKGGPGVEFLEYLKPGPGIPYPEPTFPDDVWSWKTKLYTKDVQSLYEALVRQGGFRVLACPVKLNGKQQFLAHDPDGHTIWVTQP